MILKRHKAKIGLIDADLLDKGTTFPNLSLMKIAGEQREMGNKASLIGYDDIETCDKVFLAKVFDFTKIPANVLGNKKVEYNGTGFYYDKAPDLPKKTEHTFPYYDLYKEQDGDYYHKYSIGYTTRGCFRKCEFCVNKKYNKAFKHSPLDEFVDESKPYICLLDDNLFAYAGWEQILEELSKSNKPFQFKQGLDIRLLDKRKADILKSVKYKGDFIFAFDNIKDKELIENKLKIWRSSCNKSTKLYLFCAFNNNEAEDIVSVFERIEILFKHSCIPYVMRYKDFVSRKHRGMYINLARWCNQPSIIKKLTFQDFCEKSGGASLRYLNEFKKEYPQIAAKYFNLKYH